MFHHKIIITTVCILWLGVQAVSQVYRARVLDEEGLPQEGAYITNIRSTAHAHSNANGLFILNETQTGDTIIVSLFSYLPKTIVFNGDTTILDIHLTKAHFQLKDVLVRSNVNHLNVISEIDTRVNPVNSSQELLRRVPGLFIGQHAGGGKAEQIFLRGFDIDHGTDVNISVDGLPVNMVSHAHGQGYADLHFVIPETVERIDFDKGPYHANKGNFTTAGYVAFQTKKRLEQSAITVEAGKFNTLRMLGLLNVFNLPQHSAYVATEFLQTAGYFNSPQNFNRLNLLARYTGRVSDEDSISFTFSNFGSKWNASGQIPQRAVSAGMITRFGSIDSTEGGNTQRTNVVLHHSRKVNETTTLKNLFFYSLYGFELYSNFTFFLQDPANGDQIRQKENRELYGYETSVEKHLYKGNAAIHWQSGAGLRYDKIKDIELSHTLNRKTILDSLKWGDIAETNLYAFTNAEIRLGKWLINPALRADYFINDYTDKLASNYSNPASNAAIISPKLNFIYNKRSHLQYFLKLGKSFHSNDTRVMVDNNKQVSLPAAYGADAGVVWKPAPPVIVNAALWYLYLQQEFVYVGDEGVVEPGGKTERKGIDLSLRWQVARFLFLNSDFTYSRAAAIEETRGNNYIPLAPNVTYTGGLSYRHPSGFAGSIRTRILGNRPANEDNSLVANGYMITDANVSYQFKRLTVGIITENITNAEWNETQFATTSRIPAEVQPVTEIHFTPGTPFNIRGTLTINF